VPWTTGNPQDKTEKINRARADKFLYTWKGDEQFLEVG
jgi:hypothetical protein